LHWLGCWHFSGRHHPWENDLKLRLDKLLLERGLAGSRERAQSLILAGKVLVNGQKIEKSGAPVDREAEVRLLGEDLKYVSRGGLKLEKAFEHWKINVTGKICLDVGASTGGFTDCLLQYGAARVIAIDTGHGQIDFRLRQDPRVRLLEKTNARYLTREQIDQLLGALRGPSSIRYASLQPFVDTIEVQSFSEHEGHAVKPRGDDFKPIKQLAAGVFTTVAFQQVAAR